MAEPADPLAHLAPARARLDAVRWEDQGVYALASEVRRLRDWLFWIESLAGEGEFDVYGWAVCALAGRPAPPAVSPHPWWLVDREA
jgi:hypothetical protein